MTKRMLIDATHAEETRVVVLDGNRLEDYDVETSTKKQLKGNIYLAKVVRVEPSLQAAFVEYGGGRHGFLAFGEIHPDYYQIPVADRQRLLDMQEAEARAEEEAEDAADRAAANEAAAGVATFKQDAAPEYASPPAEEARVGDADEPATQAAAIAQDFIVGREEIVDAAPAEEMMPDGFEPAPVEAAAGISETETASESVEATLQVSEAASDAPGQAETAPEGSDAAMLETSEVALAAASAQFDAVPAEAEPDIFISEAAQADEGERAPTPETLGGGREQPEEEPHEDRAQSRFLRSYKIQEVIRRRQILLIQVVKEERGTKGAALTTYVSLAGRFSVLMPNSPRGGGISRKITSAADRRRLKEVTSELAIPRGMGLIVRTAGANRPKAEIKRDCEYLLELWDSIRETTMQSVAPALIHEEASLIKRAIRDNYSRDVDEVLVDGEAGWRAARDFMRMLMPAHARKVQLWNQAQPLFASQQVELQLDSMLSPTVQLKSGGYLVINQTEALVAIDVNSGRSTRERGIEETALKTNLEAADEVARQLRLRDLAGLIVIDFIDMESRRNNTAVEKRIKDALKDDRARIQLGSISHFGLLEMSRQRLRPSLAETSFVACPHCGGTGHVRSTETAALHVLRAIEDEGAKRRSAEIMVNVAGAIALYVLNHKRVRLAEIEARYGMTVAFAADETLLPPQVRIDKIRAQMPSDVPVAIAAPVYEQVVEPEDDVAEEDDLDDGDEASDAGAGTPEEQGALEARPGETAEEGEQRQKRRRRRRRGGRKEEGDVAAPGIDPAAADQPDVTTSHLAEGGAPVATVDGDQPKKAEAAGGDRAESPAESEDRSRRRGRRGGRRRRRDIPEGEEAAAESPDEDATAYAPPVYAGPTPADPFGGGVFDIYDVMEQAEQRAEALPARSHTPDEAARAEIEADAAEATVPSETVHATQEAEVSAPAPVMETSEMPAEPPAEQMAEPAMPESMPEGMPESEHATTDRYDAVVEASSAAATDEHLSQMNGHAPEPEARQIAPPTLVGSGEPAEKKRGWWRR
jgi:ribonuclease E